MRFTPPGGGTGADPLAPPPPRDGTFGSGAGGGPLPCLPHPACSPVRATPRSQSASAPPPDRDHHRYRPVGAAIGALPPVAGDPFGTGAGAGVAVPLTLAPPGRLSGAGAGCTPVSTGGVTVTVACPLTAPCVAVMCAVPGDLPVPLPVASTLTTRRCIALHVTWLVRSAVLLSA